MVAEGTYLTTVPSNDNAAVMEAKLTAVCDVIRELEAVNRTPVPKGRGRQANAAVRLTITRYYADRLRVAVGMPIERGPESW